MPQSSRRDDDEQNNGSETRAAAQRSGYSTRDAFRERLRGLTHRELIAYTDEVLAETNRRLALRCAS